MEKKSPPKPSNVVLPRMPFPLFQRERITVVDTEKDGEIDIGDHILDTLAKTKKEAGKSEVPLEAYKKIKQIFEEVSQTEEMVAKNKQEEEKRQQMLYEQKMKERNDI